MYVRVSIGRRWMDGSRWEGREIGSAASVSGAVGRVSKAQ